MQVALEGLLDVVLPELRPPALAEEEDDDEDRWDGDQVGHDPDHELLEADHELVDLETVDSKNRFQHLEMA